MISNTAAVFRILSAVLLIAGTTVGGGMLGLPIETAVAGFWPSLAVLFISCLFMMLTGLLLVEVSLWMEEGAHMMTMASRLLGKPGRILSILLYLFMAYASLVAYIAGGSAIVGNAVYLVTNISWSYWESCALFSLTFGCIVFLGTNVIGRVNAILVIGMVAAYIGLVKVGTTEIQPHLLSRGSWFHSLMGMPLILTTFSYQLIVPSLTTYLDRNPKSLRIAVIGGTLIPFFFYGIWQLVVLGAVPLEGPNGLAEALAYGRTAVEPLRDYVGHRMLSLYSEYFAFFALVTSFLGIALGLFDFFADLFKMKKDGWGKSFLGGCVIIPSMVLAIIFPNAFIFSLQISGGYGDAILNGMMPVLMIWVGRYIKKMKGPYQVFGGRYLLVGIFSFALLVLLVQTLKLIFV